jgi:hypothetical protein
MLEQKSCLKLLLFEEKKSEMVVWHPALAMYVVAQPRGLRATGPLMLPPCSYRSFAGWSHQPVQCLRLCAPLRRPDLSLWLLLAAMQATRLSGSKTSSLGLPGHDLYTLCPRASTETNSSSCLAPNYQTCRTRCAVKTIP